MRARAIQIVAGLVCTLFFLALALYRVPLRDVGSTLAGANPRWIAAAMAVYTGNLLLRARRWQLILGPIAQIPYPTVVKALVVGYGLNTVMPARLGELFRAEFLNTQVGVSRVGALTSIVVERLFDGLTVVACLGAGLLLAATNKQNEAALIDVLLTGGVLFGAVLLIALCLTTPIMSRLFARSSRWRFHLTMVLQGLSILRTWRTLGIVALTVLIYLPDTLTLWLIVKALGLGLGVADALVLLGAAGLGTLLPSGPAFLGALQFAYALAIEFAGGPRAIGIAAATLVQLCLLLPVAVVGVGILAHGSGGVLYAALTRRESKVTSVGR
ncbi:MAG: flippase-like domain-containing protein [Alphaproteobacteria bacterium]|nr:flippase-like domain-containing protein [Alphaproteobacteria bacterium]